MRQVDDKNNPFSSRSCIRNLLNTVYTLVTHVIMGKCQVPDTRATGKRVVFVIDLPHCRKIGKINDVSVTPFLQCNELVKFYF